MRVGGRLLGTVVIVMTLLIVAFAMQYTSILEEERTYTLAQLMSLPQYEHCNFEDTSMCPQADNTVVLPELTGIGLIVLGILLGIYLIQSDHTHKGILKELQSRRADISEKERRKLVLSVLTKDERKVVEAVRKQEGISQATLRLRTDFSKAKLSTLVTELERRGLVKRKAKGKTNEIHLARNL